jgi:omega-6 fatty acid desaturase (delta-12 desaturase)
MNPGLQDGSDQAIRSLLEQWRGCDNRTAVAHLAIDVVLWLALIPVAVLARPLPFRIVAACGAGVITVRLASIAHDACHRSYVTSHKWNKFIGRVAFLPALQPCGTWELAHNIIHHSWTSVKDKDYVWIPLSKGEFDAAPPLQRLLERLYRNPLGHGLYYFIELWCKRVVAPSCRWSEIPRRSQRFDIALTAGFLLCWLATVSAVCLYTGRSLVPGLVLGVATPVATWFWLFGFVLYVQHTHPDARFFRERRDRDFYIRQLSSATHMIFPVGINRFMHGIFEHSAHHLDVAVPFYRLSAAQSELDRIAHSQMVIERWSVKSFLQTARVCKLYDYDRHCWLGFDGLPGERRT